MDQESLLITLEGYGMVPCLCELLETFCDLQQVVPIQNGFHGPAFPAKRVTTQGGLVSLTLFNLVVDNVIRTWLAMTADYQRVAHYRLVETFGRCLRVLYANDGLARPVLAATLDEHPFRTLLKVWHCDQRLQVTYNDVQTRHTMVGDVIEGQGFEVQGGGRLVPGETQKKDPIPVVWSGYQCGVNDGTLTMHTWDRTRNRLELDAG